MPTVALIGPDGAGKTTVGRRLEATRDVPIRYLYMGVNLDASGVMLPTTRLALALKRRRGGRADMVASSHGGPRKPKPTGLVRRALAGARSGARIANWMAEEWFRQILAWYYQRRGYVVVFDRHFFADYYAYDIAGDRRERPLASRLHGLLLDRIYPKPDLVICLDAPAEVLSARKGEGSLEWLEQRRQEYLQLRAVVPRFEVVDASRSPDEVARDVAELIRRYYSEAPAG